MKQLLCLFLVLAGIAVTLDSCIPSSKPGFDVSDLTIEKKSNGYLFWFAATKRIDDVEAFISKSNWLIITIANASMDIHKVKSAKLPGIIRKIEVEKFETAVQVSVKLSEKGGKVEVVRDPGSHDILVALFSSPGNE